MPKINKEPEVVLPSYQDVVDNVEAIERISEIPRLMKIWGATKREALKHKHKFDDAETIRKLIEKQIKMNLVIPDDGSGSSEKVEINGIGSFQKVTKPTLKVHDWTKLMEWCVKVGWTEIIQKRQGQTAVIALDKELLNDVDLQLPEDIAEFQYFPQLVVNKSTKLK